MKLKSLLILCFQTAGILATAQTCNQFVGGYIPAYRDPAAVDYAKLSHAFYAFADTNADGDLLVDDLTVFNTFKISSAGKQRFLSLAGGGAHSFGSMTTSATAINNFAAKCVDFCKANNLQGIDVDWEAIITADDSIKFNNLIRHLASSLHSNDLQLVITLGYGSYGGDFYDVPAMLKADWIQLMVYDQAGTWNDSPFGNHATYQHMLDAIAYWKGRGYTDVSKMVIGLPFYGYKFKSAAGGLASAMTYSEIVAAYPNLECDVDDIDLVMFNGPETIRKKVEYVMANGLKGVMIWDMGQDIASTKSKSLLNAVSKATCGLPSACGDIVSAVDEQSLAHRIQLLQNPVKDQLQISFQNLDETVTRIDLIDNLGRIQSLRNETPLQSIGMFNVASQAAGIYSVRIVLNKNQTVVKRVIKN